MNSDSAFFPNAAPCEEIEAQEFDKTTTAERLVVTKSSIGNENDADLLTQVGSGSKSALAVLFRRHQRAVFNVAWRILKDRSEAEDLRQEVFLLLLQKAKLFDAKKGDAASWIIQITYHRAMNRRKYLAFRQHYDAQQFNEEQIGSNPGQLFMSTLFAKTLLHRLRDQLSPDQEHTITLHFFEGYSLREIAEMTHQTLGSVRHHYYRGLERLRSACFPQKGEPE